MSKYQFRDDRIDRVRAKMFEKLMQFDRIIKTNIKCYRINKGRLKCLKSQFRYDHNNEGRTKMFEILIKSELKGILRKVLKCHKDNLELIAMMRDAQKCSKFIYD